MDATDIDAIVELKPGDSLGCLALSEEAQWNQNEADWQFFLSNGTVFGVRDAGGKVIATAALLPYTDGNAWISMVLVTANWQRRGIATKLLDACLDAAAKRKLTTWLDATSAGTAVYGPLGFTPSIQLQRMRFTGRGSATSGACALASVDELIARDRGAMGFDRSVLVGALAGRFGSNIVSHDDAIALVRDGRTARHIGPVIADHSASAIALIETIAYGEATPILMDVTSEQRKLIDALDVSGWTHERSFQRMRFGRIRTKGTEPPFAGAGPEYG